MVLFPVLRRLRRLPVEACRQGRHSCCSLVLAEEKVVEVTERRRCGPAVHRGLLKYKEAKEKQRYTRLTGEAC